MVLCEDKRSERFFRRLLVSLGYDKRLFDFETAPAGRGSAEAWVRKRYPGHVRQLRSRSFQQGRCLVAVRDGDKVGVRGRNAELNDELLRAGLDARKERERIATPVPTWSIETWLLALLGASDVDEATSFKTHFERNHPREKRVFEEAVGAWDDVAAASSSVPSLADGFAEMARIRPT